MTTVSATPEDRSNHPNRSNLYEHAHQADMNTGTDKEFPGLKKFQVYSPDGGVNHFHANSMAEGLSRVHESVSNVGIAGRFGYTVHAEDHPTSPGLQISGGIMHTSKPHPNERDQNMRVLHEPKPTFNPHQKF